MRTQKIIDYNNGTMKKKYLVLLGVPLLLASLIGCSSTKGFLTYGSYISQDINSLKILTNEELINKTKNEGETFLLATYQSQYSESCFCWSTFLNVIVSYNNEYHENIYLYDAQRQDSTISNLKIESFSDSTPCLYIFKGERQLAKYSYKNKKDKGLFEDTSLKLLNTRIHQVVKKPVLYFVDKSYLENNLNKSKGVSVLFMRSGCGDCSYVLPNVIIPYINSKSLSKNIWLFDMQSYYDLRNDEAASEEEKGQYKALKNQYGLSVSSNQTYGYQEGVVPTLQYYEDGILKDATVYFNDVISQKDDGTFYISDSYYTNERLPNLKYLKNSKIDSVLKDKTISTDSIGITKSGMHYWMQKDAAKYHTPILEAFLDYYLI